MAQRVLDIFVLDKNERPHHTRMVDAGVSGGILLQFYQCPSLYARFPLADGGRF